MFFNFVLSYYGLCGYWADDPFTYVLYLRYLGIFYFSADIFMEVVLYKRYAYISHHLITIGSIWSIEKSYPLDLVLLMYFCAESTSLVSNMRYVLKKNNSLSPEVDQAFFVYYNISRNIAMPVIIYHFYSYPVLFFSGCVIQCMTFHWTYLWLKSIRKYKYKCRARTMRAFTPKARRRADREAS
jgi:hypothetical protein